MRLCCGSSQQRLIVSRHVSVRQATFSFSPTSQSLTPSAEKGSVKPLQQNPPNPSSPTPASSLSSAFQQAPAAGGPLLHPTPMLVELSTRHQGSGGKGATLSSELPVIHPFTNKIMHRASLSIQQLIAAGFEIVDNSLVFNGDVAKIKLSAIKAARIRAVVAEVMGDPDGSARLQELLSLAKESIRSPFVPSKLMTLPDPILEEIDMTPDQEYVMRLASEGYHLYVGGSAGTGKTVLLKSIERLLSSKGLRVAMCATTGVASVHLGGCTFHHAFSVPMSEKSRWDASSLRAVDVLIVDEVSLLNKELLESFNRAAQLARLSDQLFGGIQVILCGDFLQLSMGNSGVNEERLGSTAQSGLTASEAPCFRSPLFRSFVQLALVTTLRHKEGDRLLPILRTLRLGEYDQSMEVLVREVPTDDNPTYIFPKRRSVQNINAIKLSQLVTEPVVFAPQRGVMYLIGTFTDTVVATLPPLTSNRLRVSEFQDLILGSLRANGYTQPWPSAVDCVVMPHRLQTGYFCIRFRQPRTGALYQSFPQITRSLWEAVCGAVVEKLGGVVRDVLSGEPESIIPYTAAVGMSQELAKRAATDGAGLQLKVGCKVMITRNLSRTVSNGSIGVVESFRPLSKELLPKKSSKEQASRRLDTRMFPTLPVVRLFSGELVQIPPVSQTIGGEADTFFYAHDVFTLPLQLGYAFTVHKVQGLTLDGPVVLDCEDFFRCPHLVYVACSRVRSLEQLFVKGLDKSKVIVDDACLQFTKSLQGAHEGFEVHPDAVKAAWVYNKERLA